MLATTFLLALAQQPAETWTAPNAAELMAAAGVALRDAGRDEANHLAVPGVPTAAWRGSRTEFQSLPFARPYLLHGDQTHGEPEPVEWASRVSAPTFAGAVPELVLHAEPGKHTARGTLRLQPAARKSEAGAPLPVRQILGVESGCALAATNTFPISVDDAPIEIEIEWDLRSPIPVHADNPYLTTDFGEQTWFKARLAESDPLVDVPRSMEAGPDRAAQLRVRTPGSTLDSLAVEAPPCLELASREQSPDGELLSFRETGLARTFHTCPPIRLTARTASVQDSIVRHVQVFHRGAMRDRDGRPVLFAVVINGERVELWSRGTEVRLVFPDRVPCSTASLRTVGYELVESARIPNEAHHVDLILGDGRTERRLRATLVPEVAESFAGWSMACGG